MLSILGMQPAMVGGASHPGPEDVGLNFISTFAWQRNLAINPANGEFLLYKIEIKMATHNYALVTLSEFCEVMLISISAKPRVQS